jgi:integrase
MILRTLQAGTWKQQRITLGKYPTVSLAEARQLATAARTRAERGENPAAVRQEQRAELEKESRNSFAVVRDEFFVKYRGRQNRQPAPRTLQEIKRVLNSDLFANWQHRPVAKITRRDVLDVLDTLVARGAEVMANRTLAYLSMFFGWAMDRDMIQENPTDKIKKPGAEKSRERVLSLDELRAVWQGIAPTQSNKGDLFATIVKILLLTGQRRDEVAGMRWPELNLDAGQWTLPAHRTKNKREHFVPLSEPVLALLKERHAEQKATNITSDFVFTSGGPRPFSGWSRSKKRLDGRINISAWTLHDLRRTLATRMAEDLAIPPHIIETMINHVSGVRSGVAGTYNRALYLDERDKAFTQWADYVLRVVGETQQKPGADPGARPDGKTPRDPLW